MPRCLPCTPRECTTWSWPGHVIRLHPWQNLRPILQLFDFRTLFLFQVDIFLISSKHFGNLWLVSSSFLYRPITTSASVASLRRHSKMCLSTSWKAILAESNWLCADKYLARPNVRHESQLHCSLANTISKKTCRKAQENHGKAKNVNLKWRGGDWCSASKSSAHLPNGKKVGNLAPSCNRTSGCSVN